MFWGFILLVGLGVVFTKLGAYSVTVMLLSSVLKLVAVVALCTFIWLFFNLWIYRYYKLRTNIPPSCWCGS